VEIFFTKALQLILCFALLVILHEGGHFLFAKLFKVRVEKFCLFFDPWLTLFKFKPRKSDTTYALGWLPLGGYVKISGMIDESMDTEQMKQPVQPWEFRAKPAWQRLLIMIGGVLVNFITALVIYAAVLFTWGETYVPIQNMSYGFKFNEQAQQLGFRDGDILLGTDSKTFKVFDGNVYRDLSEAHSATVLRAGKQVKIAMPGDLNMLDMIKQQPRFVEALIPSLVDSIIPNRPAAKAGIHVGDQIVGFNDKTFTTVNDFEVIRGTMNDVLAASPTHADSVRLRNVTLLVRRANTTQTDTLKLQMTPDFKLGIAWYNPAVSDYKTVTRHYGFFESIPAGVTHGCKVLAGYVDDLKYLFTADGAKSVGSFAAIGNLFPESWNWCRFWELTAFISLMLAFMNLLPIPALDGGHVFFLLVEVITRRKPSDKFMERAQTIGMILLLLLMALAIFNDARNFLF
jgi:RIP metalloprotease rseP